MRSDLCATACFEGYVSWQCVAAAAAALEAVTVLQSIRMTTVVIVYRLSTIIVIGQFFRGGEIAVGNFRNRSDVLLVVSVHPAVESPSSLGYD